MKKKNPVKRSEKELIDALREQYELLLLDCDTYDKGSSVISKHISVSLRILFHDSKNSQSLLKQLRIRDGSWLDSSHGLHLDNKISECSLLSMKMTAGKGGEYVPKCLTKYNPDDYRYRLFSEWYNMPIMLDDNKNTFSRRQMIEFVANTDGGAHVDNEIESEYKNIAIDNYFQWKYMQAGLESPFEGRVERICMRQIAFEVIETINKKYRRYIEN